MTLDKIGSNRSQAVWRLVFAIIIIATGFVIPVFLIGSAAILGIIWYGVDVILQLATNDEGWVPGLSLVRDYWDWVFDVHTWLIFGEPASFPWPM